MSPLQLQNTGVVEFVAPMPRTAPASPLAQAIEKAQRSLREQLAIDEAERSIREQVFGVTNRVSR